MVCRVVLIGQIKDKLEISCILCWANDLKNDKMPSRANFLARWSVDSLIADRLARSRYKWPQRS